MGFFDTLRRVLGQEPAALDTTALDRWAGETPTEGARPHAAVGEQADAGAYDRVNWHKKLKRILDDLPASAPRWAELMTEARALNLDPEWVTRSQVDEFLLLVRRAVSDRNFTEDEHRKLDIARDLIGIPEAEAEAALHSIVAEAETFFGKSVEGA